MTLNKLRTTPNAWKEALAATSGNVRAWLETQAETFPSCVNLSLNPESPLAAQAADSLRAGKYAGRTGGAIRKIIEALTPTNGVAQAAPVEAAPSTINLAAPLGACASPAPLPVVAEKAVEPVLAEEPRSEKLTIHVDSPSLGHIDVEVNLVLNPTISIRDAMKALANSLKD
jgi:hypothetical protein